MQPSSLSRAGGATHTFAFSVKNEDGPHKGRRHGCCAYLTSSCDAQLGQLKVLLIGHMEWGSQPWAPSARYIYGGRENLS